MPAGWANILNAAFNGQYVHGVSLTFTGTIYEYEEAKLEQLRMKYLGAKEPKGDKNCYQFQTVGLAVGRFEYKLGYAANASASLKANIARRFAGELGVYGGVETGGVMTIPNGATAFPLWREDW